jgi:predicted dehydrogenase
MHHQPIRWGIVGPGKIARKFADDLRLVPGASLHAVASRSLERSQAFAEAYDTPYAYDSCEALAECPGLDVVYIATPHTSHYEHTMFFIEKGIPVLCEKPFAMDLPQAKRMANLAQQKGVFLMEAVWTRFIPATVQALAWIAEGKIGDLCMVQADFGFKSAYDPASRLFDKALGGGSLLDIGIYPVWLAVNLLGKPAAEHIRAAATFSPSGGDETCSFSFTYEGNRMALGFSTIAANTPIEARIYGEKGSILLHKRWHHTQQLTLSLYQDKEMLHETIELPYEGWGYAYEARHVADCLANGLTESPLQPLSRTLEVMETLDHIRHLIGLRYD